MAWRGVALRAAERAAAVVVWMGATARRGAAGAESTCLIVVLSRISIDTKRLNCSRRWLCTRLYHTARGAANATSERSGGRAEESGQGQGRGRRGGIAEHRYHATPPWGHATWPCHRQRAPLLGRNQRVQEGGAYSEFEDLGGRVRIREETLYFLIQRV